jgi:hypothetical protein
MNDELIKQLQEAKFPFKRFGTGFDIDGNLESRPYVYLKELIEACGYSFRALMLHTENLEKHPEGNWHAKARRPIVGMNFKNQRGETPEEAVAKLWLALNKIK